MIAEPNILAQLQSQQAEIFAQVGFPTRALEAWRYTNLSAVAQKTFAKPRTFSVDAEFCRAQRMPEATTFFVFVNGQFAAHLSDAVELRPNFLLANTLAVLRAAPETVLNKVDTHLDAKKYPLIAQNIAEMSDGFYAQIPANHAPIFLQVLHVMTESDIAIFPRNIVQVGPSSQLTILEEFVSTTGENGYVNSVSQIVLEKKFTVPFL